MVETRITAVKISAGAVLGLLLLLAGILLTLDSFGVLELGRWWEWWPVALIVLGAAMATLPGGSRGAGIILAAVGVLLLVNMRWGVFWPLVLILLGGMIVWRSVIPPRRRAAADSCCGDLGEVVALGGKEVRSDSKDFRGGSTTAIMGGVDVDLRRAATGPEGAVLDLLVLMGGVEVRVPETWEVTNRVTPIMGAYEDKRTMRPADDGSDPSGKLTVQGTVVMGAVEVKN